MLMGDKRKMKKEEESRLGRRTYIEKGRGVGGDDQSEIGTDWVQMTPKPGVTTV